MTLDDAARRLKMMHRSAYPTLQIARSRIRSAMRDLRIPMISTPNLADRIDRADAFDLLDTISEMTAI